MTMAESAYRASSDCMEERNELVMRELPQVYYIAARIRERVPKNVDMEDLVQAGVIGLIDACRNYDSTKDAQFSTFAKFRIRGAILDDLRTLDWGSRALRKKGREITSAITKLESFLGRQPEEEEIAKEMRMSLNDLHDALTQLDGLYMIGQQADFSRDDGELFDLIESAPSADKDPLDLCLESEKKARLAEVVSKMPEREQLILSLYYKEELTMKEISKIVGIAVSRVSQLHAAAMVKLRALLSHPRVEAATPKDRLQPVPHGAAGYKFGRQS